ncbi:MAG TPA: response regulator transcription factor [Verrucomicrobiae bacterium]
MNVPGGARCNARFVSNYLVRRVAQGRMQKISGCMAKLLKKKIDGQKSRIFLVEDHPVFRDGLAKLLNAEDDLTVCGEAGEARQALKSIIKLKPALAVVDLGLPGKSGLELIKEIRGLKLAVKLLVVSMFDEALYAQRVLRAGGDGYVMKQADPQEIILAIRDVLDGHIHVSEDVFSRDSSRQPSEKKPGALDLLTDSELEVLELLGQGKSTQEISPQVGLSEAEVNKHNTSIRRKLKLESNNALVRYAVSWVEDSRK